MVPPYSHMEEVAKELSGALLRSINPIYEGFILMTHFLKSPPPNFFILGARISTDEFLGDTNIQTIVLANKASLSFIWNKALMLHLLIPMSLL